jgi:hypothetical protein
VLGLSTATVNKKAKHGHRLAPEESERRVGFAKRLGRLDAMIEDSGEPLAEMALRAAPDETRLISYHPSASGPGRGMPFALSNPKRTRRIRKPPISATGAAATAMYPPLPALRLQPAP